MTKLLWGKIGERYFESGVDRGVLYVNGLGVAWNGLKSIQESSQGGGPKPFYLDGIKYLNISETEEFEATIEAFSAPAEFGVCDGAKTLYAGLTATQQPRKPFSLSYRTKVGNDISGLDLGYKIHLVYGALAGPSSRDRTSLGGSTDPISLSWSITTTPPVMSGIRPTAHLVIDSRTTPKGLLKYIEDILYGTSLSEPRMPLVTELLTLFSSLGPEGYQRINEVRNPRFGIGPGWVSPSGGLSSGTLTLIDAKNTNDIILFDMDNHVTVPNDIWSASMEVEVPFSSNEITLCLSIVASKSLGSPEIYYGPTIVIAPGQKKLLTITSGSFPALTNRAKLNVVVKSPSSANSVVIFSNGLLEKSAILGTYFDGSFPSVDGNNYSWESFVDFSRSLLKTWN